MSANRDEKQRVASLLEAIAAAKGAQAWDLPAAHVEIATPASTGDDCAVLDLTGELSLVCGSDYVRGVRFALFELGLLDLYDLGYYVVVANISDVAAMGAQPVGVLTIIRYPSELSDDEFDAVFRGAQEAAVEYGCGVLGGDTGGAERLILSATALGICEQGTALLRSGARPGDTVCLTGSVGAPAAAVLYFSRSSAGEQRELPLDQRQELLSSWKRPAARVAQGRLLASEGLATACQDVSDGLRVTAEELAESSDVRVEIDEGAIPIDPIVKEVASRANVDPLALAMSASVDFELLFTVAPEQLDACREAFRGAGFPLHEIGETTQGRGAALRRRDGSLTVLPGVGWRHQQEDVSDMLRSALRSPSARGR
jgi:thiamine-monophosphate kinase